jgi:tetratricopeptide (TPR) repeat protein
MRIRHYAFAILITTGCAAPAFAQTCDAYFTKSQSMKDVITGAYAAMGDGNLEAQKKALPSLEAALNTLPAVEIKPEVCNGTHINAYTAYQSAELGFLRGRGVDIGFPANLPIVKQPELNHRALAYAVGWIKYELSDFAGALTAFEKGLAMYPHDPDLQNEYLATLLQLNRNADVISYSERVLANGFDLSDGNRAKIYKARGVAQFAVKDLKSADDSMTVALRYQYEDDTSAIQKQIQAAMPKPN